MARQCLLARLSKLRESPWRRQPSAGTKKNFLVDRICTVSPRNLPIYLHQFVDGLVLVLHAVLLGLHPVQLVANVCEGFQDLAEVHVWKQPLKIYCFYTVSVRKPTYSVGSLSCAPPHWYSACASAFRGSTPRSGSRHSSDAWAKKHCFRTDS